MSKVERDDAPIVRAEKWAERWSEEADRTRLVSLVEGVAPTQRQFSPVALLARAQACSARALLWRREAEHRKRSLRELNEAFRLVADSLRDIVKASVVAAQRRPPQLHHGGQIAPLPSERVAVLQRGEAFVAPHRVDVQIDGPRFADVDPPVRWSLPGQRNDSTGGSE